VSLRRQSGALKFVLDYTWSKTIDLVSTQGADASRPIDSFNLGLNRARARIWIAHMYSMVGSSRNCLLEGDERWDAIGLAVALRFLTGSRHCETILTLSTRNLVAAVFEA
jgi:hypothetical protein